MGGEIKYTCSNGGWSKSDSSCKKTCIGKPNLDAGSSYYGSEGTFYDANMNITTEVNNSSYAKHGAIFDVNCSKGYQEIYLINSAYNTNNGNKPGWGHYYYCNNGEWISVGRCLKSDSKTFYYTKSSQTFIPPISNNEKINLNLEIYGAQGGGNGGKGGKTTGSYNYTLENGSISIWVGGTGGTVGKNNNGGIGGYNGGGNAGIGCGTTKGTGGGGGGRSNIDLNGIPLIIAGGGGGGSEDGKNGGDGGGSSGGDGEGPWKGFGGTQNGGGASNSSCANTGRGSSGYGGNGCASDVQDRWCGGGGGGGYFGGGAGDWGTINKDYNNGGGGGGGGSGFCGDEITNCIRTIGGNTSRADGYIIIEW